MAAIFFSMRAHASALGGRPAAEGAPWADRCNANRRSAIIFLALLFLAYLVLSSGQFIRSNPARFRKGPAQAKGLEIQIHTAIETHAAVGLQRRWTRKRQPGEVERAFMYLHIRGH